MSFHPINGHVEVKPLKHESFISSQRESYEEIGEIVSMCNGLDTLYSFKVGDLVYFDSWLCAKYPKGDEEFHWLVKSEDIRAYESVSE